jgi:hypothetical protein
VGLLSVHPQLNVTLVLADSIRSIIQTTLRFIAAIYATIDATHARPPVHAICARPIPLSIRQLVFVIFQATIWYLPTVFPHKQGVL